MVLWGVDLDYIFLVRDHGGVYVSEIDRKIAEKRETLEKVEQAVAGLRKSYLKNLEILRTTVTVEEAQKMYESGTATFEEFQEYKAQRELLEYMVSTGKDCLNQDPVVEHMKAEIRELEAEKRKETLRLWVKSILFMLLLFLIVPVLVVTYGLMRIGVLPLDLIPYILFTSLGVNVVIWIWAYIWSKNQRK